VTDALARLPKPLAFVVVHGALGVTAVLLVVLGAVAAA
jgi:hypothetical protein